MVEDIICGVAIFIMLFIGAMIGRYANFPHSDIWS